MSIWDGLENTETYERGNYMKPGFIGVVEITKTILKETRAVGPAFIAEMKVVKSNMDEHPPGQKVSWFQKLTDKDIAFPSIAEWAAAVGGVDPANKEAVKQLIAEELKQVMEEATDNPQDNAFIGQQVALETVQVTTKNDRLFTRHNWSPVE